MNPDGPSPGVHRRSKKTPALEKALLDALRVGATRSAACGHVDIDTAQFYRWLEKDAAFRSGVARAEAEAELRFTAPIMQAASAGDWRAGAFWLERRRREDWHEEQKLALSAEIDIGRLMRESLVARSALPEPEPINPEPDEPEIIDIDPPHANGHVNGYRAGPDDHDNTNGHAH